MIGPYDKFAVEWGYKPFPEARPTRQEKAKLDEIVARQVKDATLRFGDPNGTDPSVADRGPRLRRRRRHRARPEEPRPRRLVPRQGDRRRRGTTMTLLQNMYTQLDRPAEPRAEPRRRHRRRLGRDQPLVRRRRQALRRPSPAPSRRRRSPSSTPRRSRPRLADRPGHRRPPRGQRRGRPDPRARRPSLLRQLINDNRCKRMAEQVARDPKGAYSPLGHAGRPPQRDLVGAEGRPGRRRPLPPEPPAGPPRLS